MSRPRTWKRVQRGQSTDLKILQVREDTVADPRHGKEHPRVIIEAPDWVNILPLTSDGQVVLIRQFRFGVWEDSLEIPGGMVDPGEEPQAAAVRELEEETGYRPREVVPLGFVHPNPAFQTNRCHSFLALGCEKVHDGRPEDAEDITVELRPATQLSELVQRGEITHSLVVAAFYLYEQKKRGQAGF